MSVAAADLKAPTGELESTWFPADDAITLDDRLAAYIDAATDRATADAVDAAQLDAAVRAYAYHRAYLAIYLRLSEAPSSISIVDQGSRSRTSDQRNAFKQRAEEHLATYLGLLPAVSVAAGAPRASASVANLITW